MAKRVRRVVEFKESGGVVIASCPENKLYACGEEKRALRELVGRVASGGLDKICIVSANNTLRKEFHRIVKGTKTKVAHETTEGTLRIFSPERTLLSVLCHLRGKDEALYAVFCAWAGANRTRVLWEEPDIPRNGRKDPGPKRRLECDECGAEAEFVHYSGMLACAECCEEGEFEGLKWEELGDDIEFMF
jgi:hypothetical protein